MLRFFGILCLACSSLVFGKVYDCFMFFNEYEVLDIRFHELYEYVDHFVIVESCETFAGNRKPFNFEQNKERYSPFLDKVIYIKLTERQDTQDPWVREYWQRNQIMRGLVHCDPNDVIMLSDCDEFLPGHRVQEVVENLKETEITGFIHNHYAYQLNRLWYEHLQWSGMGCVHYQDLISPVDMWEKIKGKKDSVTHWQQAGWHFSYMGGLKTTLEKLRSWGHCNDIVDTERPEYEWIDHKNHTYGTCNPNYDQWIATIRQHFPLVPIDESYPQYVQDNVDYFIDIGLIDPY